MTQRAMWKYEVPIDGAAHKFTVPKGTQAVAVGMGQTVQEDHVGVWAAVNVEETETEEIYLMVLGTGHTFEDTLFDSYVGTVVERHRPFVWHVVVMSNEGTD